MNTHKGSSLSHQFSRDSLCINSQGDSRHDRGGDAASSNPTSVAGKENESPNVKGSESSVLGEDKEDCSSQQSSKAKAKAKPLRRERALRPSSLQFCMQMNEFESGVGSKPRNDPAGLGSENPHSVNIWDYSDSEAAPASSWATLPNKTLLCRPLPVDIGKCTCVIIKEAAEGASEGTLFTLYTNEGKGRQDRKLAVAFCKRRNGKSVFTIAQSVKGASSSGDDSLVGTVTANLMGSKYQIWDQGISSSSSSSEESRHLLAVVTFMPTIATWTGSFRNMRAYVPKHQSMQLKNPSQVQHIRGLPNDWDEKVEKVHQLISRVPHYNKITKQYELDFRDKGKSGNKVQRSVKNFQLKLEENGKQTILQLGRVGKSKYIMDYRYPLTGYQAFCICLASIDSKLCCTV